MCIYIIIFTAICLRLTNAGLLELHFSICANQRLVQDRMRIFSTIAKQVRLSGRLGWFDPSSVDIRHLGFLAETCMCKVIGPRDLEFSHIYICIDNIHTVYHVLPPGSSTSSTKPGLFTAWLAGPWGSWDAESSLETTLILVNNGD